MNDAARPVFQDVIAYARELLNHGEKKIVLEIVNAYAEQQNDEEHYKMIYQQFENALDGEMDTNDFDNLVMIVAQQIREGQPVLHKFAKFTADVLEGKRSRPTKPGPDPYRDYLRNIKLNFVVEAVAQKFDIPRYAKGNPTNKTAVDAGSETAVDAVSEATRYSVSTVTHALHAAPIRPEIVPIVTSRLGAKLDS
jgi:hypothetical protein